MIRPLSIVALVKGGLGNQMFCYAAGRALALRTGRSLLLDPRSGFVRDGYGRSYLLDRLPIHASQAGPGQRLGDNPKGLQHRVVRSLARLLPGPLRPYVQEIPESSPDQLLQFRSSLNSVYLSGYWQNEEYFRDAARTIRPELTPKLPDDDVNRALGATIQSCESVFIHVRRVRYSPRLDAGYYQQAIAMALEEIPEARFFVFSDDPGWARTSLELASDRTTWVTHNGEDGIADLALMSRCQHAIIANSSFSWWGAWLIPGLDKKVFAPADGGWPLAPAGGWIQVPNRLEG